MNTNQIIQPQILSSYQIIKKLGSGAYGHVWKVQQKSSKKIFALKKIFQAFQHATDSQRTFRQISILKKICHKNIIKLYDVLPSKNGRDVYLVFQYMQTDLYHAIYENILQFIHKKYVIYQLLVSIHYLHTTGLIHRDLKPSNILLDSNCTVKVCDFGLARLLVNNQKEKNSVMTQGVATRWYRAPQVLLGSSTYGQKADIWSIGCIIAQMIIKNPMFPGSSTINQLQKILQFTGKPDIQDIHSIECQYAQQFIQQCGNIKQKSPKQYFGNNDPSVIDLIYKILVFNPTKRLSIQNILKHKFFEQFFNEKDIDFKVTKKIELQVDDNQKLSTQKYKQLICNFDSRRGEVRKQQQRVSVEMVCNNRSQSAKRDRSPLNSHLSTNRLSPLNNHMTSTNRISKSRVSQVSPSKSPQRFKQLKKTNQPSFSKLLGSQKLKKRSDSRQSSHLRTTQVQQKKNYQLFSQLIKNKDSTNRHGSKSRSRLNDKQNISNNTIDKPNISNNVNDCLKRFQNPSNLTPRVSFQGLKKTTNLKFNRQRQENNMNR